MWGWCRSGEAGIVVDEVDDKKTIERLEGIRRFSKRTNTGI